MTRERRTAVRLCMRRYCRSFEVAASPGGVSVGCPRCRAAGGGDAGSLGAAVPSKPFTIKFSGRTTGAEERR